MDRALMLMGFCFVLEKLGFFAQIFIWQRGDMLSISK